MRSAPILAEATYDNTDPANPVEVTPQVTSPNFWLLASVPEQDDTLHTLPGWVHTTDRQIAINNAGLPPEQQFYFIMDTKLTPDEMNAVVRLSPVPAGSNYPFAGSA